MLASLRRDFTFQQLQPYVQDVSCVSNDAVGFIFVRLCLGHMATVCAVYVQLCYVKVCSVHLLTAAGDTDLMLSERFTHSLRLLSSVCGRRCESD